MVDSISQITSASELINMKPVFEYEVSNQSVNEGNAFLRSIQNLNTNVEISNQAIQDFVLKKDVSTHELMIAMEQAKHSLQVAVEVRNKIVQAYDSITRMRL